MKLRSLLYDAGCAACTDIARQAEAEAKGWLRVKPLHDAEMRALLEVHAPNLGRRPALVTQDGERVTVDTGWKMLAKLLLGVGPGRCWRLLRQLAQDQRRTADPTPSSRRKLLRAVGGSTLATVAGYVMAKPSSAEPDDGAVVLTGEKLDAVIAAVRAEANVQIAEHQLLELGFLRNADSAVALQSERGPQLTMIFYPDASGRPDRAGVMVHERQQDGTSQVLIEIVEANPEELFDANGALRDDALKVTGSRRIGDNGVVVPRNAGAYLSCMFVCLGVSCGRYIAGCGRLPFLALVLACIVGYCGRPAYTCHNRCKRLW